MAGSKIRLYGSTSGYVELEAPAVGDDGVLSLPTAADGFGAAGIGSNVVQTVKTDVFVTTSTSYTLVTGLSATITPTSATSKILVIAYTSAWSNTGSLKMRLRRGVTDTIFVGTAAGSREAISAYGSHQAAGNQNQSTIVYLDSPATTSATTYDIVVKSRGGETVRVNAGADDDNNYWNRLPSSITLIEVAA